ncbi:hypothetical protein BCR33DRAFT_723098 [Rhizoclosmatium globosum]|uniref:Uncharacterized protein n=1 Tax=Rhizoclosmatium globosum TaxID=329046 RepID=A0A1Y2BGN2_9FUNG|nr:hypothetical protein BCR33DRAFT_723098 [Rhizoclosmatium globosum]|eukprot:ORY33886.1 hypothetical protein BCR33DRAFT_723098 [Rhizoclosmatium globosum]
MTIVLDVLMGLFDIFVTGVYLHYLRRTRRNGLDVKKFVILSQYGIVSVICLEFWTRFTYMVLNSSWVTDPIPPISRVSNGYEIGVVAM